MRKPLWHFVALGALLFALRVYWAAPEPIVRPALVVDAQADSAIDDEILFREALARQFDRDKAVRARLVALGRFLGLGRGGGDDAVEREARTLDLQRTDPVVRRHLVEMMRLTVAVASRNDRPSESTLRDYYERHAARFAQPARTHLVHVYLSAERRGAGIERDAAEILTALREGGVRPAEAAGLGDPFVRGADLVLAAPAEIDAAFGTGFGAAVDDLPLHAWAGPVRSTYGLHLVWVEERIDAGPPAFAAVRNRVLHEMLHESRETRLQESLRALREQYDVRSASPAS